MSSMEELVSGAIVRRYFAKLQEHLKVDVAIAGAGPSGLVAGQVVGRDGRRVAVFESKLAPGGGIWGGGMLFNEIVVQDEALPILDDFRVRHAPAGEGLHTADAVEVAAGLLFGAVQSGATVFNAVRIEDLVFTDGRVGGVVINWNPVSRLEMHVDPLVVTARAVLDGTGHPSEIVTMATRKGGIRLDTPTGGILGERPMWAARGEVSTVEHTRRLSPGLYASGMAANNVAGGFRMGPVFGGMLRSGRKAARLIAEDLDHD